MNAGAGGCGGIGKGGAGPENGGGAVPKAAAIDGFVGAGAIGAVATGAGGSWAARSPVSSGRLSGGGEFCPDGLASGVAGIAGTGAGERSVDCDSIGGSRWAGWEAGCGSAGRSAATVITVSGTGSRSAAPNRGSGRGVAASPAAGSTASGMSSDVGRTPYRSSVEEVEGVSWPAGRPFHRPSPADGCAGTASSTSGSMSGSCRRTAALASSGGRDDSCESFARAMVGASGGESLDACGPRPMPSPQTRPKPATAQRQTPITAERFDCRGGTTRS